MKNKKPFVACLLALALAAAAAQADQVVKIGLSSPLTGPQAVSGKDNENALRMAVDELNQKGVVVGGEKLQFELISEDDQADPRVGVQVAQKLVDEGVVAVLGPYNSGVALPASAVYKRAGVPILSVASNPALTTQGFTNIFRIGASDAQLGSTMADYAAKKLNAKTAAVIDDRTAYGQGLVEEFSKEAQRLGIKIIAQEYTSSSATDFLAILASIKVKKPDVVFLGGYAAQGAPLVKQMRQRQLSAKLLGGDSICTPDMGRLAGPDASVVYCAQGGVALDSLEKGRAFTKAYKERFNTDTQVYGVSFYDGMMLLAEAMVKADSTDSQDLLKQLPKTQHQGIAGEYRFDEKGDLTGAPSTVYTFENGQLKTVQ
ncbi:MAG: branched-chain amino acid ABC transporter substrate-binding protein [Pseudomonas sp.]